LTALVLLNFSHKISNLRLVAMLVIVEVQAIICIHNPIFELPLFTRLA